MAGSTWKGFYVVHEDNGDPFQSYWFGHRLNNGGYIHFDGTTAINCVDGCKFNAREQVKTAIDEYHELEAVKAKANLLGAKASAGCEITKDDVDSLTKLRPSHYAEGEDTFAWMEKNCTVYEQLAICKFNIHKYFNRDKGQDYEDFGKVADYAMLARKCMTKLKEQVNGE